jgi:putative transcriptional regulator
MGSVAGKLLVAAPALGDPNFDRTVIFVLEHTDDGALGLVLNRRSAASVEETLPRWTELAAPPPDVFVGGPVDPQAAICLATVHAGTDPEGWQRLSGELGVLDLDADPALLAASLTGLRIFAGYAGWSGGQLDGELAAGGWYVVVAAPGDVMTPAPEHLWRQVLRRQRGPLALVSTFPPDPRLN